MREKDHYLSLLPRVLWSNRALTLLELILVVAILGTVSGIAIPSFLAHRDKVLAQEAISDIAAIDLVLQKYYAENGKFPDSLAEIGQDGNKDPGATPTSISIWRTIRRRTSVGRIKRSIRSTRISISTAWARTEINLAITSQPSWDDIIGPMTGYT